MKPVLNLLIIDDSEDDREFYRRLMRKDPDFDWIFFEAETGAEGLEYIKGEKVDAILLDYSLPGHDGLETLASLRDCNDCIPIVMLTGQGNEEIAVEAMRIGAMDYIKKEKITASAIQRAVHSAIDILSFKIKINAQQKELEKFANILAHDLKEPARSIAHLVNFLRKDMTDSVEGKSIQYLHLITDASERMINLIDTVSAYTIIDAAELNYENVSLEEAVENVLSNLDVKIKECDAQVTYDPLPKVCGHLAQLTQLLQNLVGNGIKYCENRTPRVHIRAEQKGGVWVISVKDNGIGMKEKFLQKVFEAFQRLHTSSEYEGTGLGLAICRKIVDRHNGEIWCTSKEGEGSVFYFSLPINETEEISETG